MNPMQKLPNVRITSPLLAGIVSAFLWLCVGAVLASVIVSATSVSERTLAGATFLIHAIAALFGGVASGKRSDKRGWYHGALLGAVYAAIVLLVGFLSFDAGLGKDTALLLAATVPAAAVGGMVGVNLRRD